MSCYCPKCGACPQNSGVNCLCSIKYHTEIVGVNWSEQTEMNTDDCEIKIRQLQTELDRIKAKLAALVEVLRKISEWGCNGQCVELVGIQCPCCIATAALDAAKNKQTIPVPNTTNFGEEDGFIKET